MKDLPRAQPLDAERAGVAYRGARNQVISAREQYDSALDQFKIRLGMSTGQRLGLAREEIELFEPDVTEAEAIGTALKHRLDLLNQQDAVDDARRGVKIARNNLLPDFNFSGSVSMNTNPNKPSTLEYNTERTTWRGMLEMELPLDRKEERNRFRSALIDLRRSERRYEEFRDRVRAEVRRAKRQIALFRLTLEIQAENITIGEFRAAQAKALDEMGRLQSNRDVIEAENDLRDARNTFSDAQADYRVAILDFLLSAGALRIDDDGAWVTYTAPPD
ncbi:MAG: TolC family protein, partial [Planctomycetes bacterium]|nr:TolC family protein [Planctomycetota bacterium]